MLALVDGGTAFPVQPGLPRLLLWPESVEMLFGATDALPRIVSTWPKCYLDLTRQGYSFATEPAPLSAIYVLADRVPAGSEPCIREVSDVQALIELVANTYANDLIETSKRAQDLECSRGWQVTCRFAASTLPQTSMPCSVPAMPFFETSSRCNRANRCTESVVSVK